jgi:hypothetical protein
VTKDSGFRRPANNPYSPFIHFDRPIIFQECNYVAKNMAASGYTFIREIESFDIDDYLAHLGWNSPKINHMKIYTQPGSSLFYLHDEIQDRMYAFEAADPGQLNSMEAFERVVKVFQDQPLD